MYISLSLIALTIFVIASLVKSSMRNTTGHDPQDPTKYTVAVKYFESLIQLYRTVVVGLSVFLRTWTDSGAIQSVLFLFFLMTSTMIVVVAVLRPHVYVEFNIFVSGTTHSNLCLNIFFRKRYPIQLWRGLISVHLQMQEVEAHSWVHIYSSLWSC